VLVADLSFFITMAIRAHGISSANGILQPRNPMNKPGFEADTPAPAQAKALCSGRLSR
jgi:hypothetical protein